MKRIKGFTLIEVLIAIAIIALLTSIIGVSYTAYLRKARKITAKSQISNLSMAIETYFIDNNNYPTQQQGLKSLVHKPTVSPIPQDWNGPYLNSNKIPKDPWGNEYIYKYPGIQNPNSYDLYTLGKDGEIGGEGEDQDIGNWED